jgi:hypothetical protein
MGRPEAILARSSEFYHNSNNYNSALDNMQNSQQYILWSTNMNTRVLPEYFISIKFPERNTCKVREGPVRNSKLMLEFLWAVLVSHVVYWKHVFRIIGSFPILGDVIQWFVAISQAIDIAGNLQSIQDKFMFFA